MIAKPAYTTDSRVVYTTSAVNSLPTTAQSMPAVTPPMSAGFHFTRVLGTNMYTAVKMAVDHEKRRHQRGRVRAVASQNGM